MSVRAAEEKVGRRRDPALRLIAVFKLVKGAALVVVGLGALRLIHRDVADTLAGWVTNIRVDPDNRFVNNVLERASGVTDRQLEAIGLGTFFYAALLLTEGVGLLLQKRWAEYFTVIVTASFIPLELYELVERVTPVKIVVLAVNVAIVWYLVHRLTRGPRHGRHTPTRSSAVG